MAPSRRSQILQNLLPPTEKYPKTTEGKQMCMKYLIRGFCDASCIRAHKLPAEDEAAFDKFYHQCREEKGGDAHQDF
jgi:hypothetical protein